MLDSEADFKSRCRKLGLTEDHLQNLDNLSFASFGHLAFATSYTPGQQDDTALRALAVQIVGADPPPPASMAIVRRLVFESYTMAAADLKSRVERRTDEAPRKLVQAERAARYENQRLRLAGVDLTGEMEASNSLIDLVYHLGEEDQLRYVRWEECTKRDQELMGLKSDPVWKPDSNGIIKEVKVQEILRAETDTDLKLRYALARRSIAFDQARLLNYFDFEQWPKIMMEAYTTEPPPGYLKVGIEQLHRADMQLFKVMMKETRSGIKPIAGRQPLAAALKKAIDMPEVRLCLQPLQGTSHKRKHESPQQNHKKQKAVDVAKLQRQLENVQGQLKNLKSSGHPSSSNSKGQKGKGKGGKNLGIRMPPQLIGLCPTTPSGDPCCYDFNLNKCQRAKNGERCPRGWHVCVRHGCGKPHSQLDHE